MPIQLFMLQEKRKTREKKNNGDRMPAPPSLYQSRHAITTNKSAIPQSKVPFTTSQMVSHIADYNPAHQKKVTCSKS